MINKKGIDNYTFNMQVWWNRQTRRLEGSVVEIPCGFESHHLHHLFSLIFPYTILV